MLKHKYYQIRSVCARMSGPSPEGLKFGSCRYPLKPFNYLGRGPDGPYAVFRHQLVMLLGSAGAKWKSGWFLNFDFGGPMRGLLEKRRCNYAGSAAPEFGFWRSQGYGLQQQLGAPALHNLGPCGTGRSGRLTHCADDAPIRGAPRARACAMYTSITQASSAQLGLDFSLIGVFDASLQIAAGAFTVRLGGAPDARDALRLLGL